MPNLNPTNRISSMGSATVSFDLENKIFVFYSLDELVALPLPSVEEVIDIVEFRPLPRAPKMILGIYNLRNDLLPIIDLSYCISSNKKDPRLNRKKPSKNEPWEGVVITYNKEKLILVVDHVDSIVTRTSIINDGEDELPSAIETNLPLVYIESLEKIKDVIIKVLDLDQVLAHNLNLAIHPEEMEKIEKNKIIPSFDSESSLSDQINPEQLDALKEVANIASGHSVTALSNFLNTKDKISLSIEEVSLAHIPDLLKPEYVLKPNPILGIKTDLSKELAGVLFILFPIKHLQEMSKEYLPKSPKRVPQSIKNLTAEEESFYKEFGNILGSHYISGISDFLHMDVIHNVPELALGEYGALLDGDLAQISRKSDEIIVFHTEMKLSNTVIKGKIIFLPDPSTVGRLLDKLDVEKIVADSTTTRTHKPISKSKISKKSSTTKTTVKKTTKTTSKSIPTKATTKATTKTTTKTTTKATTKTTTKASAKIDSGFTNIAPQTSYEVPSEIKQEVGIDNDALDAFRELGNIGAGNAGNALSQILNKKVLLDIPPAKILSIKEITDKYVQLNHLIIGYYGKTEGLFSSDLFLLFHVENIEALLQILLETQSPIHISKKSDLKDTELSAVQEIMNILMGHYISAMSDFLKTPINPPEYQLIFDNSAKIFKSVEKQFKNKNVKAVLVETGIKVEDNEQITGNFIVLLEPTKVKEILDRVNEIWYGI